MRIQAPPQGKTGLLPSAARVHPPSHSRVESDALTRGDGLLETARPRLVWSGAKGACVSCCGSGRPDRNWRRDRRTKAVPNLQPPPARSPLLRPRDRSRSAVLAGSSLNRPDALPKPREPNPGWRCERKARLIREALRTVAAGRNCASSAGDSRASSFPQGSRSQPVVLTLSTARWRGRAGRRGFRDRREEVQKPQRTRPERSLSAQGHMSGPGVIGVGRFCAFSQMVRSSVPLRSFAASVNNKESGAPFGPDSTEARREPQRHVSPRIPFVPSAFRGQCLSAVLRGLLLRIEDWGFCIGDLGPVLK